MNTKELLTFFEGLEKKIGAELTAVHAEIQKAHSLNIKTLFATKRRELEDGLKGLETQAKADLEATLTKFSDVAIKVYDSVIPPKATSVPVITLVPVASASADPVASTAAPDAPVSPPPVMPTT